MAHKSQWLTVEQQDKFEAFGVNVGLLVRQAQVRRPDADINGNVDYRVLVPEGSNFGISEMAHELDREIRNVKIADEDEDGDLWIQFGQ